jgi:hypothetical protein
LPYGRYTEYVIEERKGEKSLTNLPYRPPPELDAKSSHNWKGVTKIPILALVLLVRRKLTGGVVFTLSQLSVLRIKIYYSLRDREGRSACIEKQQQLKIHTLQNLMAAQNPITFLL